MAITRWHYVLRNNVSYVNIAEQLLMRNLLKRTGYGYPFTHKNISDSSISM